VKAAIWYAQFFRLSCETFDTSNFCHMNRGRAEEGSFRWSRETISGTKRAIEQTNRRQQGLRIADGSKSDQDLVGNPYQPDAKA
jgi:hypothetical protein